jgi:hypothetical protein
LLRLFGQSRLAGVSLDDVIGRPPRHVARPFPHARILLQEPPEFVAVGLCRVLDVRALDECFDRLELAELFFARHPHL